MMDAVYKQRAIDQLARQSLIMFVMLVFEFLHPGEPPLRPAWYLKAICWWLEKVGHGEIRRSMIWLMPRTLKSITAAVAFPCWLLGHNPSIKIMIVTYPDGLSAGHADNRRQILESDFFRRIFPKAQVRISRIHEIKTSANGHLLGVSVLGTITGRGADLIIMDDCMRSGDQDSQVKRDALKSWYTNTLATRLNDKRTGSIVSIQQRQHEDDLPAFMLDRGFECLRLPAVADRNVDVEIGPGKTHIFKRGELLDPERFHQEVLDFERRQMGPRDYAAQYMQDPIALEGNLIRPEWFSVYDGKINRTLMTKVVQSWDTAATASPTSDWSVGMTWGYWQMNWYLLEVFRQRLEYPDLRRAMLAQMAKWNPDKVLVEHAGTGLALVQELRLDGHRRVQSFPCKGDKQQRMIAQTAEIETGKFFLPEEAPWLDDLMSELRAFPFGKHDDQVDALSQFVEFQKLRFRWVEEERVSGGRLLRPTRLRSRPARDTSHARWV